MVYTVDLDVIQNTATAQSEALTTVQVPIGTVTVIFATDIADKGGNRSAHR
jgi:hypothetical protein